MTISISSDVLLAYLQVKTGQTSTSSTTSSATAALQSKAPKAPWNTTATSTTATTSSALVPVPTSAADRANQLAEQIIAGKQLVNPAATTLSQTTSSPAADTDYQNLFALYQGLTSLQSLADAASSSTITSSQLAILSQAFTSGLGQVRSFISSDPFQEFAVSDGAVSTNDETSVGVQQSTDTYDTAPLVENSPNAVVPALQGDIAFSMTATNIQGQATTVDFDLDDMGSTPRTLSNVVTYLNGQLKAAGLKTTFATNEIPGQAAVTTTSDGMVTTVAAATPDQYGLQINGTPNELLSFSAAATPSVYIAQTSTDPAATTTSSTTSTTTTTSTALSLPTSTSTTSSTAATTTSQFIKLDEPATSGAATTRGFTDDLPAGSTIAATATAADGSVYVLADVTATNNGQTLQGSQDAALYKYDSAGNLVFSRTLGSAGTVAATALAVSSDGSQVAVAGSVTGGALDPTDTSQDGSTTQQSFVQVYDAAGEPLWSYTEDGDSDNQANAVSFGAGDTVYIAGSTQGDLPAAASEGGQDGYLQGFNVTTATDPVTKAVTYSATSGFTQEFGTSGVDRATGVAVSGSSVYVSSVENGDAVVRRYDLSTTVKDGQVMTDDGEGPTVSTKVTATLGAKQDLGGLNGGNVSGVAIGSDGSVLVTGSTHDAALDAGTITDGYSGNGDAFLAQLNTGLDPAAGGETLAYYNGGGPTSASAITVSGGQAYITGQVAGASLYTPSKGFAAAIDPSSGQVGWSTTFTGDNGSAAPSSIAVSTNGASALDALGLPQGALQVQNQPSQLLTANSSVQAGDSFYVQTGTGSPQQVTISADDTYDTLAEKIKQASGYSATVTPMTIDGEQQLRITPANGSTSLRIEAGPDGQDALGPLGLKEGLVSDTATAAAPTTQSGRPVTSEIQSHYSITVPDTLSLSGATGIAAAQKTLSVAIADVQSIYSDMTTAKSTAAGAAGGGTVPAYLTAQISKYQLALARLQGSTSTSGANSAALAILTG